MKSLHPNLPTRMNPTSEPSQPRKPRLALLIATGFGLGKLPWAPGTWGSLGGVVVFWFLIQLHFSWYGVKYFVWWPLAVDSFRILLAVVAVSVGILGVWSAGRVSRSFGQKDPQIVVVDEISGQFLVFALSLGAWLDSRPTEHPLISAWMVPTLAAVNWKYLVVGFILFRVLDIWKPFPARRAERLPGGWGIMADDWVAGVYAALGLWAVRAMGL